MKRNAYALLSISSGPKRPEVREMPLRLVVIIIVILMFGFVDISMLCCATLLVRRKEMGVYRRNKRHHWEIVQHVFRAQMKNATQLLPFCFYVVRCVMERFFAAGWPCPLESSLYVPCRFPSRLCNYSLRG